MEQYVFWRSCEGVQFNEQYHLQTLLGIGGFGAVFQADEVIADHFVRTVALKVFNPFMMPNLEGFIREVQTTAALQHPHLITTYAPARGTLQSTPCFGLVMELAGEDLAQQITRCPLSAIEAQTLVSDVAAALAFLHERGMVHRDIKPQNIMRAEIEGVSGWKVGDLGIMRLLSSQTMTLTQNRQGSPFYVPPEAYRGEVSTAADIWAFGVTIVQALTGQLPFPGPSEAQVMYQVLNEVPRLPSLPPSFDVLVRKCLTKDRGDRWTAQQILQWCSTTVTLWDIDLVPLSTVSKADYAELRQLLKAKQWRQADQETQRLMCQIAGRQKQGWLSPDHITYFPCVDLQTIDTLWLHASEGHYGFSVQKALMEQMGATINGKYPGNDTWHRFAEAVGWRTATEWVLLEHFHWTEQGPRGHLPAGRRMLGYRLGGNGYSLLFQRLNECQGSS